MQNKTKWGIVNGTFFGSCWLTGMILILLYVPGDFSFRSHQVDLQVISSNIVPNICRVYRSGIDQQCYKLNVNYMYNFKDD